MIMNIYAYGTLMIWVIAVIVLFLYQLDKRYPEIMKELKLREARGEI